VWKSGVAVASGEKRSIWMLWYLMSFGFAGVGSFSPTIFFPSEYVSVSLFWTGLSFPPILHLSPLSVH